MSASEGTERTGANSYLDLLFFTGFAFLACHELDAVMQAEWRLLPVLNRLNDDVAYVWFVLLHIPLFALPMWWTASRAPRTRFVAQVSVDLFMVIHLGLHVALRSHPDNTFHSALSEICIYGAGIVGLVHGLLALRVNRLRQHDPGTHSR